MAIDPVCGMTVNETLAKYKAVHMGKTYFFCKLVCRERFKADPQYYLNKQ